jgi:hypothetical protein
MTGVARLAALGLLTALGLPGCLRAFGPDLCERDHHAGLAHAPSGARCMDCHVSEPEAIALGVDAQHPAPAPIVAAWMLDESRECVVCHRVWTREDETRGAWRLAPLAAKDDDAG